MKSIEEYIESLVNVPAKKQLESLDSYYTHLEKLQEQRPKELNGFKQHIAKVTQFRTTVDSLTFGILLENVFAIIQDDILKEEEVWLTTKGDKYEQIDNKIDALKSSIEAENKAHNDSVRAANDSDNATYNMLESKRKQLEQYSDKIIDMCNSYGVSVTDVDIDESQFTPNELNVLYDDYIKFMQKESKGVNIVSKFRNTITDTLFQGIILVILLVLCFTPILDFVAIGFFITLIITQVKNSTRYKYYSTLLALVFHIDPVNMGYVDLDESQLLPEELTDEMMDNDERFSEFETMYEEVDKELEESEPNKINQKIIAEWSKNLQANQEALNEKAQAYQTKLDALKSDIDTELKNLDALYKKLVDEYKFLGNRFTDKYVFNSNFTFGLHDDCIEEKVDIGVNNVIIRTSKNQELFDKFMQTMVVNAFASVAPGNVRIHIFDPNGLGKSIMPLFKKGLDDVLLFYNDTISEALDDLEDIVQQNLKQTSGKSIAEYNAGCEVIGTVPITYNILIVLSQPKSMEEDEKLMHLFEYSATGGVFIWLVSDLMQSKTAHIIRKPWEGVQNPIIEKVTDEWCGESGLNLINAIENAKPKGLKWTEFVENVIPPDRIWKGAIYPSRKNIDGHPDDDLDLLPGYLDGDPSKYKPYTIGNTGNVHCLGVGGTGSGKSVFLNHMICTLSREYSPKDLELWLIDFKGTEFISYLPTDLHPWILPQIKACLCTSDGDYAASVFHAFRQEADLRYSIMQSPMDFVDDVRLHKGHIPYYPAGELIPNTKDTVSWNNYWRNKAKETKDEKYIENCWPRALMIADEFQVIFESADPKNLDIIKADITQIAKVGRAANVHQFFTSQSMQKTISADIQQQFTLRFCLKCDKAVSRDLIESDAGARIKTYGFLYVKDSKTDKDNPAFYKTPYFTNTSSPDGDFYTCIHELYDRAKKENCLPENVITYLESDKYMLTWPKEKAGETHNETLEEVYQNKNIVDKLPDSGVFFLGNRMAYDQNKAPDNIVLTAKNNTHIMAVASDYNDYVMLFNQLMFNIQHNKVPGTIIINTQVHDLGYLCDIEKFITFPDKHSHLLWEKDNAPKKLIAWFDKLFQTRKEKNKKDSPVWIFLLGWEKAEGIGVNGDYNVRGQFTNLLQVCGEYNIHFIMMNTTMMGINIALMNPFNYKLAAKCSTDDSMAIIGTKQAGKNYDIPNGWIFSQHDGATTRDKLYLSELTREIQSNEIVLT